MWLVLNNLVKGNNTPFMSYLHKNMCTYLLSLNSIIIIMAWSASLLVLEVKESSLLTSKGCDCVIYTCIIIPTAEGKLKGVYWIHLVRLPVCGQNWVAFICITIFAAESISVWPIVSTNCRTCVACWVFVNISKFDFFAIFFNFRLLDPIYDILL